MAHETQYWSFKYIFGTAYSAKTEASLISPGNQSCQSSFPLAFCNLHPCSSLFMLFPLIFLYPFLSISEPRRVGKRTDSGGLDHVADGESLDCLVLGCAS